MIKFRCSGCQKGIGVEEKYAGLLIKCPACQNATKVPEAVVEAIPVAEVSDTHGVTQRTVEATLPHIPQTKNPICPSCNTELFNPSDTMCGICGHLLEPTPVVQAPLTPRPPASNRVGSVPVAASPGVTGDSSVEAALLVNPAISSPCEKTYANDGSSYSGSPSTSRPKTGRSVGAWFAAVAVGMFLALIWGIVAAFTGPVGQVFAWAIGAIVGLIAGLVARSSSLQFCLATTAGALLCMLFGRLVSAWVIMLAVGALSTAQQFGEYLIPDTGLTIGVMEEMSSNGEFEGEEKLLADAKVDAFFANKSLYEMVEYDNFDTEVELSVDKKVRDFVREMTEADKISVLERVRKEHLEWMEEAWYFNALMDTMVENGEIEDEELLAHAQSKIAAMDGSYDGDYYQNTTPKDHEEREEKLLKLVMKRFAEMDLEQRNEALKKARLNHLSWTPVRHEFLAMLDAMYESGDIPVELKRPAKSTINLELSFEYDAAVDENDADQDIEKLEKEKLELQAVVNKELLKLEQDELDQMVTSTMEKYPAWQPEIKTEILDDLAYGIDDQLARFESDGTFSSSIKTRFKTLDFVWLTLGTISAFAIVFTLGQSGKKSSQ